MNERAARRLADPRASESIVYVLFPPRREGRHRLRPRGAHVLPGTSLAAEVLGEHRSPDRGWLLGFGLLLAAAMHGGVTLVPLHQTRAEEAAGPSRMVLKVEHVVELNPPESQSESQPEPPPRQRRAPRSARGLAPRAPAKRSPADSRPPAPAQAREVVANSAPAEPLDFADFTMVSGKGSQFAGGVTASTGTRTTAVHSRTVDPNARGDSPQAEASLSQAVSLPQRHWDCPWPREASNLGIDEQSVLLRVVAGPEGRVVSAELLADPGYGFGRQALSCARRTRFQPARDHAGKPYAATSPPIRVRFTR